MREANSYSYMESLDKQNLLTLEERRNRSDFIEVFKMAKNLSPIPLSKFFELNTLTTEPVVIHLNWSNIVATTKSVVTSQKSC